MRAADPAGVLSTPLSIVGSAVGEELVDEDIPEDVALGDVLMKALAVVAIKIHQSLTLGYYFEMYSE